MLIKVTQEDIDLGVKYNGTKCAVGRAVRRQFDPNCSVVVYSVYNKKSDAIASLPASASDFIKDFDDCRHVKPFEFELDVKS